MTGWSHEKMISTCCDEGEPFLVAHVEPVALDGLSRFPDTTKAA